ncbi:hypothetical protein [Polaribacter sp. WD7]|uniref:hypothetical protein n=1 Tax=Polaribacter sp. WD7 TaxID=2269061 RepID=UPI0015F0AB76|nr:hypothetical protein [Polaribacter sp. WD7]
MKFHKFISIILHPIVIPTVGVFIYFLFVRKMFSSQQRLAIIGLTFVTTYIIPLLILILFKKLKVITSYHAESIKERKIPITMMIILFYLLGNTLFSTPNFRDFGLLFYATSLGLTIIYILFFFRLKVSIHLLSLGVSLGFFLMIDSLYSISFLPVIVILILLSGIVASARLHLKAHTSKEVYLGFFLGLISPIIIYFFL